MDNVYVFYGEEKTLIDKEINKLIISLFSNEIDNKISKYSLQENTLDEVLEDVNSMSLFDDKKMVICNDCSFLVASSSEAKNDEGIDSLIKYLDKQNEATTLVLVAPYNKLDDRKKIVKLLKNTAKVKEFNKLNSNDLINYINSAMKEKGYDIGIRTINLLVDRVEGNLEYLNNELEKLMLYKLEDKKINEADIEELVRVPISDNIFELVEAVVKKDINKIFVLYEQFLIKNEEPVKVIAILANQFRLIYQTKKMYSGGYTEKEIASKLGIHPYRVKLANEVRISEQDLLDYLVKLADLDIGIKTGQISKYTGLEMFFLQL